MKVTMYDSKGNKKPTPTCRVCGEKMSPVIGKEAMAWYCYTHGFSSTSECNDK